MSVRVRFAPSPTGDLHEGGALVAVANDLLRRRHGGALVLRIDDTDAERVEEGAEARIVEDLAWLGIHPDEGPGEGPFGPCRQSERAALHRGFAERLVADGSARAEADGAIALLAPVEDVEVQDLSRGAIRIPADELGPTILVRADGRPTYHLANAVDDLAFGITHVLRGEDHLTNAARQVALCRAMRLDPPRMAHLPIVVGEDGARLSSRSGAKGIRRLREEGWVPEAVVDWLARSACPPLTALPASDADALAAAFDPTRLGHGTTRLDPTLLERLGRDHLAQLTDAERARRVQEQLGGEADAEAVLALAPGLTDAPTIAAAAELVRGVVHRPAPIAPDEDERAAARALAAALAGAAGDLDAAAAEALIASLGCGKRPLRRVLTAADRGVPLPYVLAALTREESLARAQAVLDQP